MTGHCGAERVSVLCSRSCSDMGGVGVYVRASKNKCSVHIPVRTKRLFVFGQRHPLQTLMYCTNDKVMDSLGTTKAAFDEGAQAAMQLHAPPHGPEYLNVIVSTEDLGPKPATFKELTDTGPDHNNFLITETYSLESVHMVCKLPANKRKPYYVYDYGIQDHVFSDRPESKRASAVQGWLRFNEMSIPAARREWKVGGRDREPEKEAFNVDKLHKRLELQLHAGTMPTMTARRASLNVRGQRLAAQKRKLKRKADHVAAAMEETHGRM